MKSAARVFLAFAAAVGCVWGGNVPTITVLPALAPNVYGSPYFAAWQSNAIYALIHGLSSYGDPTLPSYYHQGDVYNSAEVLVTPFPSWMGQVDPGTVYGSAFANEHGNRMHFGVAINGNGTQISISELSLQTSSTDPFSLLGYDLALGSFNYTAGWVGVRVGADGALGTADDVLITSGSNTQLVDYIFGRGSGSSFAPDDPCTGCTIAQQQQDLYSAAYYPGTNYQFTATYTLHLTDSNVSGSGTYDINPIPEPITALLLGSALIALSLFGKRHLNREQTATCRVPSAASRSAQSLQR
jgi:hypothetical protein